MDNAMQIGIQIVCNTKACQYFQSEMVGLIDKIGNARNIQQRLESYWKEPICSAIAVSFNAPYSCSDIIISCFSSLCNKAKQKLIIEDTGAFIEIASYTSLSEIKANPASFFIVCHIPTLECQS